MPCPQNLNIAAILRFHTLHSAYSLKDWAKGLYGGLEIKADKCNRCKECEQKCPYKLLITDLLKEAKNSLT